MSTLINSSPLTHSWLVKIKAGVNKEVPSALYDEVKYWTKFLSPITNRVFAWLQLSKKRISLFIGLDRDLEPDLERSSSHWKRFKSVFSVYSEKKAYRAIDLIIQTYNYDVKS